MTKKIKLVFVNGLARSGKDTFTQILTGVISASHNVNAISISSIDAVRDMLRNVGVPVDDKTPEMRQVLALVGTAMEKKYKYRTKSVIQSMSDFIVANDDITGTYLIMVHVREESVADSIEQEVRRICYDDKIDLKVFTVCVNMNGSENDGVSSVDNEKTISWDRKYDFVICNYPDNFSSITFGAVIAARDIMKDQ